MLETRMKSAIFVISESGSQSDSDPRLQFEVAGKESHTCGIRDNCDPD